jgi:hypothetical protein
MSTLFIKNTKAQRVKNALSSLVKLGMRKSDYSSALSKMQSMELDEFQSVFSEFSDISGYQLVFKVDELHKTMRIYGIKNNIELGKAYSEMLMKSAVPIAFGGCYKGAFEEVGMFILSEAPTNMKSEYIIRTYGEAYFDF